MACLLGLSLWCRAPAVGQVFQPPSKHALSSYGTQKKSQQHAELKNDVLPLLGTEDARVFSEGLPDSTW